MVTAVLAGVVSGEFLDKAAVVLVFGTDGGGAIVVAVASGGSELKLDGAGVGGKVGAEG